MGPSPSQITVLLHQARNGDAGAASQVMSLVYEELHRLAGGYMRRERPDHTLQPTALVHEAYLRLISKQRIEWKDRAHFMGMAAVIMRRILVDHARARRALKPRITSELGKLGR